MRALSGAAPEEDERLDVQVTINISDTPSAAKESASLLARKLFGGDCCGDVDADATLTFVAALAIAVCNGAAADVVVATNADVFVGDVVVVVLVATVVADAGAESSCANRALSAFNSLCICV